LWRSLLPAREAQIIAGAQPASFTDFGYTCDPDLALDLRLADANWLRFMRAELTEMDRQREQLKSRLAQFEGIGPISLSVARGLLRLSLRYPRISSAVKWVVTRRASQSAVGPAFESA